MTRKEHEALVRLHCGNARKPYADALVAERLLSDELAEALRALRDSRRSDRPMTTRAADALGDPALARYDAARADR